MVASLEVGAESAEWVVEKAAEVIETPYGLASQESSEAVLVARSDVSRGASLYRLGTTGKSEGAEAQFWSLEHPSTQRKMYQNR